MWGIAMAMISLNEQEKAAVHRMMESGHSDEYLLELAIRSLCEDVAFSYDHERIESLSKSLERLWKLKEDGDE